MSIFIDIWRIIDFFAFMCIMFYRCIFPLKQNKYYIIFNRKMSILIKSYIVYLWAHPIAVDSVSDFHWVKGVNVEIGRHVCIQCRTTSFDKGITPILSPKWKENDRNTLYCQALCTTNFLTINVGKYDFWSRGHSINRPKGGRNIPNLARWQVFPNVVLE